MKKLQIKPEEKKTKPIGTKLKSTYEKSKDSDKVGILKKITFSTDPDLYFHTQAAEEISSQLKHNKYYRAKFAQDFFHAIHQGQITAYNYQDGTEMETPIPFAMPLCIKPQDVNIWLINKHYDIRWDPKVSPKTKNGSRLRWTEEFKQEVSEYRKHHTTKETAAKYDVSEQRIREMLPAKKSKINIFSGLQKTEK
jgi:hypothetical protein